MARAATVRASGDIASYHTHLNEKTSRWAKKRDAQANWGIVRGHMIEGSLVSENIACAPQP